MKKAFVLLVLLLVVLTACGEFEGGVFTPEELHNLRYRNEPVTRHREHQIVVPQHFCGDGVLDAGEDCDPPGAAIIGGVCNDDCSVTCLTGEWDPAAKQCSVPVELKCPDAQEILCGTEIQPLQGKGHCGVGTWCPDGQVCEGGSCVTATDEESLCLGAGGTWKVFPNGCADFCTEDEPIPLPDNPPMDQGHDLDAQTGGLTGYAVFGSLDSGDSMGGQQCPDTYDPVCGIDGQTYANSCLATVPIVCSGECPCSELDAQDVLNQLASLGISCENIAEWKGTAWNSYPGTSQVAFPIIPGRGYRLQCDQAAKVRLTDVEGDAFKFQLQEGMNIISPTIEEDVSEFLASTGGRCTSVEEFDGSWKAAERLEPGKGYRVRCSGTTVIDMPAPSGEASFETRSTAPGALPASIVGFPAEQFSLIRDGQRACEFRPAIESCDCGPNACWNGETCVWSTTSSCGNDRCEEGEPVSCPDDCEPTPMPSSPPMDQDHDLNLNW